MYKKLILALALLLSATLAGIAQNTSGRIVGTVNAPDGVLPGATVVVTDNQTGKTQTVVSGDNGSFTLPQLEFGTYTVKVSSSGYKTFIATDVKVDAGSERSLNIVLEVGAITEEVTVTGAGGEAINSTNAELSTTISQEQIRELPLNTRNPLGLLNLIAGANPTTSSINGQRSSSTDFRRDGMNIQDNFIRTGGFVQDQPTVDDTAEFSVTTQNAGVEQGGGSSLVSLVTPRGGQDYHGALFAFNRNSAFGANSFFNNAAGRYTATDSAVLLGQANDGDPRVPRPFLNRNQFGGSFSGRMPFFNFGENDGPLFRRDKAFFFVNYEGFRLANQVTATGTTLLTPARNGTFTFVNAATGQQQTINVLSGTNFTSPLTTVQGGVLGVDPIIQSRILSRLPTSANDTTIGINFLQNTRFLRGNPEDRNAFTSRFDYDFSDRNTFNFVYRYNDLDDARTDTAAGFETIPFVFQGGPTRLFTGSFRTTPTASFSNEIRAGYQKSEPFFRESGIPSNYLLAIPLVTNPEASFRSQGRTTDYRNIQDNAVFMWGNHSFRFGGQAEMYKIVSTNLLGTTPTYSISGTANTNTPGLTATQICGSATCINATDLANANSLRYFLGGIIGGGSRTANLISQQEGYGFGPDIQEVNYEIYSGYVSDQWRVRSNFTLNLGLRYEYYTPLNTPTLRYLEPEIVNNDLAASIQNPNGRLNIIGTNAGTPGDFTRGDKDNFAPNISFAWAPKFGNGFVSRILGNEFVLRGGGRVSYINDEYVKAPLTLTAGNRGLGAFTVNAVDPVTGLTTVRASLSPIAGFNPLPTFNDPPAVEPLPVSYARFRQLGSTSTQLFGVDPDLQLGRVFEWNFGLQREIGFNSVIEVRYVGNMSNDLIRTTDYNQIDIVNNGFLADFQRAQGNLRIYDERFATCRQTQTAAQCTTALGARSAAFNPAFTGSQQLPVLTQTTGGGATLLTNPTFLTQFEQGGAGAAAQLLITNNLRGNVVFQPNPNILISEITTNAGRQRYNALQAEIRRRFSNGFSYQVNYTFQKTLTDVPDDGQNRQGELQESNNPDLNYGRPDYDRTHTLNANMILELPFGKGRRYLNSGWAGRLLGGFQFSSIVNISSGPPLGVIDPRGTRSIAFVSGRQSAFSNLSDDEIKRLTGVFNTPNGLYFIDPKVLFATATNSTTGEVRTGIDLFQPLPAGFTLTSVRGASPIGTAPFPGQVFFFNQAGETGNLPRNFINGLPYINWDAGLSRNFRFGERARLQIRGEMFNVLNRQVPFFGADLNISSTSFGRITTSYNAPRVVQFGARFDF